MEGLRIVEAEERYCASHAQTMNMVSLEGKYLSSNKGFSYESILFFYRSCLEEGYPQYYVINEQDIAVGWCDIVPRPKNGRKVGYIGVGLRKEYRDRGIGTWLMQHAIDHAKEYGFTELRLDCRASNHRALYVYEHKLGFHKMLGRGILLLDDERIPLIRMRKKLN